jgi:hypothetical protein
MTSAIQLGVAIAMFGIAGSMIFYEYVRSKTGRPLSNNEITAMPYWLATSPHTLHLELSIS